METVFRPLASHKAASIENHRTFESPELGARGHSAALPDVPGPASRPSRISLSFNMAEIYGAIRPGRNADPLLVISGYLGNNRRLFVSQGNHFEITRREL